MPHRALIRGSMQEARAAILFRLLVCADTSVAQALQLRRLVPTHSPCNTEDIRCGPLAGRQSGYRRVQ